MEELKKIKKKKGSSAVREFQSFFSWWFHPKNSYSIVRIPLGLFLSLLFILISIKGFSIWIGVFQTNPLTIGILFLTIPVLFPFFFASSFLWGGLLYVPYYAFEKKKGNWKTLLIYLGVLFAIIFLLYSIGHFVFGFSYW